MQAMQVVMLLPMVMQGSNLFGFRIQQPKLLTIKILVIFVPVFSIAYFSEKMVYVLPALAVGVFFGASLNPNSKKDDADTDADTGDS